MSRLLFRIGHTAVRHGWRVVGAWVVVFALAGGGFAWGFGGLADNFDIPGTESSAVLDRLAGELPAYRGASGLVVLSTDDGTAFSPAQREAYAGLVGRAGRELPGLARAVDPFAAEGQRAAPVPEGPARELLALADGLRPVSADGSVAVVNVSFTAPRLELSEVDRRAVVDFFDTNRVDGVSVAYSTDIAQGVPDVFGVGEAVGLLVAGVVLLVLLGTALAAAVPIVTAVVGVGIGVPATLAFSGVVAMASVTPVLGIMLGLAVGIDYALFIVYRHRRQLADGMAVPESVAVANATAGHAVVFAGATVVVALLALNVTGIAFLGVMGTVGAVCVAVAVLIAVTLVPALLGLLGERVHGHRARTRSAEVLPAHTRRAALAIVFGVTALLLLAVPALDMRLGLPDGSAEPAGSASHRAHELTTKAFGEGANGTLLVTADLPEGLDQARVLAAQLEIARVVKAVGPVEAVAPVAVSPSGRLAAFQVKPEEGPNAESTVRLVRDLRAPDVLAGTSLAGTRLGVAGQAAINLDISAHLADVLPGYLALVVGLSLLIMVVVFRSLLVPLVATAGFVLSLAATFGAVVAGFQWGWLGTTPGPILSFLPVILVGVLFGLAMDYQLFLASGMREAHVRGAPARLAVAQGSRAGRSVVTAAALIMVAVFGGFVFADSTMIRSLGFGLAAGVLLDAFAVRVLLMPAVLHLLGPSAWWLPRWLERVLPDVDVEGAPRGTNQEKIP